MGLLRLFVRSLAKNIMFRVVTRVVRAANFVKEGVQLLREMSRILFRSIDDMLDNIMDAIDFFEAIELIVDVVQAISDSLDASAEACTSIWFNALNSPATNPGQKALIEDKLLDIAETFWQGNMNPDPDDYFDQCFSAHEAIEPALSGYVEQSWAAAAEAGMSNMYAFVAEVALEGKRRMDAADNDFSWGHRDDFATSTSRSQMDKFGRIAGGNAGYTGTPGVHNYADSGALRQLSLNQAGDVSEESWPYWAKESNRITGMMLRGHITTEQSDMYQKRLYEATADNPDATGPPLNYSGPIEAYEYANSNWERDEYGNWRSKDQTYGGR